MQDPNSSYQPIEIDKQKLSNKKVVIIAASWYADLINEMIEGARKTCLEYGIAAHNISVKRVPGTFELSLGAQYFAQELNVDALVCLGIVVKGDTPHFDYVCQSVTQGITSTTLKYNKPIGFGVLTVNDIQQAIDRVTGKHGNKGAEAAIAALQMLILKPVLEL